MIEVIGYNVESPGVEIACKRIFQQLRPIPENHAGSEVERTLLYL